MQHYARLHLRLEGLARRYTAVKSPMKASNCHYPGWELISDDLLIELTFWQDNAQPSPRLRRGQRLLAFKHSDNLLVLPEAGADKLLRRLHVAIFIKRDRRPRKCMFFDAAVGKANPVFELQ